ncbi:MAG: aminomethyl-transferring glycine dehydrogenase [Phycisphaerales bacterium]|nr:aminomethyl-transferring glycine dehydrogenase [Phycisphaerales bacterium]
MTSPSNTRSTISKTSSTIQPTDDFPRRHLGPSTDDVTHMLGSLGCESLDTLIDQTIPGSIRMSTPLSLSDEVLFTSPQVAPLGEQRTIELLRSLADENEVFRSYIGMGYHGTITPSVIQRTVLENPCWYTQYTPYQAEISQGRLEALLNFQTMVTDLTGLPVANASLLDEATAAAEAMSMCCAATRRQCFFIADDCHPQTIGVLETRAKGRGIELVVGNPNEVDLESREFAGVLVQYPATDGRVNDLGAIAERTHASGGLLAVAADPLALALLKPPGEWGADIAVGSMQRFGVPMGLGGPHAAYMAVQENLVRKMPGRLIGISRDSTGQPALRMAIQTREQHIKRDRATSNICTAQALLAIVASFYGVYHGPEGLQGIARKVRCLASTLAEGLRRLGHVVHEGPIFDTVRVRPTGGVESAINRLKACSINVRDFGDGSLGISMDETVKDDDLVELWSCFGEKNLDVAAVMAEANTDLPGSVARTSPFMSHEVFNSYRSETELLRYITELQSKDLSLAHSMIPLGSCTMKLNAASEMVPISWPAFASLHPFAPREQWSGYRKMFQSLEAWLAQLTGFHAVTLQPNAGSQGEYAGLMVIKAYHEHRGQASRNACLIPVSAHGTNPASAVVAGMQVVPVKCLEETGDIDLEDLKAKIEENRDRIGAIMVTYPSTHGVFEEDITEVCRLVHEAGGLVYMDGANMNAQVGLTLPAEIGADVVHLNLHKTFCIPHGGGGPGMGPIGVTRELADFLPGHPVVRPDSAGSHPLGPVSAAPYGSPSVLPISWMYIAMMGAEGLTNATRIAILNANYMAERLRGHYEVLYTNAHGRCAHEFILDCRPFEKSAGIRIDDIAKRLMDFGFHAPTMSWPVPGTLMIEPTESESLAELDRFCDAMIRIRSEIKAIEDGHADREDNVLCNAPHTVKMTTADEWSHPYTREDAAYPLEWLRNRKFWSPVGRVDNPHGDRNLICTCPSVEDA